ncbi:hypothetical protein LUZ60_011611 [Juncus effusus]|nr:hypothetical protein LUZ60_011611 [Juncus effusus]
MAMANNSLEVTMISAKDLKKVHLLSKMSVYAIATISGGDPADIRRTAPDRRGGRSPTWGTTVRFVILSTDPRLALSITLRSARFFRDTEVGEVIVPIKDLLEAGADGEEKFVSYQVRRPSGKPKGVLNLSCKVMAPNGTATVSVPPVSTPSQTSVDKGAQPVTAFPIVAPYPAPQAMYTAGAQYGAPTGYPSYPGPYPYPMAAPGYGYGAAPPQGYGYVAQAPKKSNFGAGLGMGLLGGALGGMVLGDLIVDNSAYDAGADF